MLRKIISIKNVGRFRSSASRPNPELSHFTLVLGANGFGKTTLCAVLRSLKEGNPTLVEGRRTLGTDEAPTVEMLLPTGSVHFDGTAWSASYPHLAIFDEAFVAQNVYSGEAVQVDQRRNLYRIVIGEEGVQLANMDSRLAKRSREKTNEITAAIKAIEPHIPPGVTIDAFLSLPADSRIHERVAEQERNVAAVRQAQEINDRPQLSEVSLPSLPDGFTALLARTIDDIARDAETRVAEHLEAHGMQTKGGEWLAEGLEHADGETCPFCGQNITGLSLISSFRTVFSERYRTLQKEISAMRDQIAEQFGEGAIGQFDTSMERNKGIADFWTRFCSFDREQLTVPDSVSDAIRALGQAAIALLDRKAQVPLEPIRPDTSFDSASALFAAAQTTARAIDDAIRAANVDITAKKRETATVDVQAAVAELNRRLAIKVRHTEDVASLCAAHASLTVDKEKIERQKHEVRARLNEHTRRVVRPYEERINRYLDAFNAGFRIAQTQHHFPSGIAATTYQLSINNTTIDLGGNDTPLNRASFKNTLSSGDRTTLALAFFLAHLQQDKNISIKTVVFDDPFGSQDAFRRRQTIHQVAGVGRSSAQVLVLSHDATFLKQIWDKAPAAERVALTLADHRAQGTKIVTVDLERACQGRTATEIDDLLSYLHVGTGEPINIIRKVRTVLETHCYTTYPACFQTGKDWLGEIVRKIREGGDQHPAYDLYDELDQINDYSKEYHHGEDLADVTPDHIDSQELTGYVKRTLQIVNALQA